VSLDLLDAAIGEVEEHREGRPVEPGADAPDPFVFDRQTLGDLHDFLRDARCGLLTADEVAQEAQMWQQLVDVAWPHHTIDDSPVAQAVEMLAAMSAATTPPVLPHPSSVSVVAPADDDEDRAVLLTAAAATVPGCEELAWASIRRRGAPEHAPWRDVLVVTTGVDDQSAVVQALSAALPASVFPSAVVVGRDADLVHPLIEAAVAAGRTIRPL
jgi:hypothetical protein